MFKKETLNNWQKTPKQELGKMSSSETAEVIVLEETHFLYQLFFDIL